LITKTQPRNSDMGQIKWNFGGLDYTTAHFCERAGPPAVLLLLAPRAPQ